MKFVAWFDYECFEEIYFEKEGKIYLKFEGTYNGEAICEYCSYYDGDNCECEKKYKEISIDELKEIKKMYENREIFPKEVCWHINI